jgi:ankyrin repeat protein
VHRSVKTDTLQVVEKHSALLEVDGEDQVPVNADHSQICDFETEDDDTFEKTWKRIERIRKEDGNCISRTDGWTALHFATCWRHHDVMLALIKGGADVNRPSRLHRTPLDIAEDPEVEDHSPNHITVAILKRHGAQNYQPGSSGDSYGNTQLAQIESGNV